MKTILKIIAFPVILVISVIEAYITTTIKWFEQFKKKSYDQTTDSTTNPDSMG